MDESLIRREPLGKSFTICVSAHHTFGTDAVLLAHFAAAKRHDRLIDLGTGCGIIPFLMLKEGNLQTACGIDISPEAVFLAEQTARENQVDKFTALCADLTDLKGKVPFGDCTLVTCNPPYKAPGAGLQNADEVQKAARHEVACTLRDVVQSAAKLLQTGGRFCLCHRPERLPELFGLMHEYRVEPKRLRLVCQRAGEEPWLVLAEGKKGAHSGLRIAPPLFVEESGVLSSEMREIYGDYKEGHCQ